MKYIFLLLFISILFGISAQNPSKKEFDDLIERANINFNMPDSCEEINIDFMHKIPHNFVVGPKDSSFQIRYWVRPLDKWFKDYNKKSKKQKQNSMHPDQLCKSMMSLAVLDASNNKTNQYQLSPYPELSKKVYNADLDAFAMFESGWPQEGFKYCYINMLHKDGVADIYIYILANSKEDFIKIIDLMTNSIKFN